MVKFGLAFWECSSPQDFTHCKAQGKVFHEPKNIGRSQRPRKETVLMPSGRNLTPTYRCKMPSLLRASIIPLNG